MQAWKRVDDATDVTVFGHRSLIHKKFIMNNGRTMTADIFDEDGLKSASVIALTPGARVIIARQFRCGPEKILDELPGGAVDPGETPEEAVRRELMEETGYTAGSIEPIGTSWTDAWSNVERHTFFATDCTQTSRMNPDDFEEIEVDTISIKKLIENAMTANMTEAQVVLLAYDRLKQLEATT